MGAFDWILPSQMPQPLGLGPMATLAPIQKAANNVTAGNPQGPKVPWVDPASVTNALTNISTAKSENQLRQQQATLTGMQATQAGWQLKMLQQMYNSPTIRQAFGLDAGDGTGTGGAAMPSGGPTDAGLSGNPSGGMPPSSDNSAQGGAPLGPQLGGSAPGPGSKSDPRGMIPVITAAAQKYGVDPAVALKVAQSEGLGEFLGDGGQSGGAFQLYTGGGLGNQFQKDTGLNPLDPTNEPATIDYAMKYASQNGWGPWHGAARIGLGTWDGIGTPPPAGAQPPGAAPGAKPPFDLAFGDSIAHGVGDATGVGGDVKDGRSTAAVLAAINSADPATLKGQRVFLSSGASNSPDRLDLVMQQVAALQKGGAQPVLAGVGPGVANADRVNQSLAKIAAFYKIPFTGALTDTGSDGVHPRNYNGLVSRVAGLGGPPAAPPVQIAQNGPMAPGMLAPPAQPGQSQPGQGPVAGQNISRPAASVADHALDTAIQAVHAPSWGNLAPGVVRGPDGSLTMNGRPPDAMLPTWVPGIGDVPQPAWNAPPSKYQVFANQIRAAAGLPQQPASGQAPAAAAVPPGIGARMAETGKSMTNTPALAAFANQIRARAGLPTQPTATGQPAPGAPGQAPQAQPQPPTRPNLQVTPAARRIAANTPPPINPATLRPYGNPAQTPVPVTGAPGMASAPPLAVGGMTPKQMLAFGLMGQMSGMPNIAAPFEQMYYNSPEYKAAVARAEAAAKLPLTPPRPVGPGGTMGTWQLDANGKPVYVPQFTNPQFQPEAGGYVTPPVGGNPAGFVAPPGFAQGVGDIAAAKAGGEVGPKITIEQNKPIAVSPTTSVVIPGGTNGAGQPVGQPGAPGVVRPGLSPGDVTAQEQRADAEQKQRQQTINDANLAQQSRATLMTMANEAGNFPQGPFAAHAQEAARYLRLISPSFDGQVASYEDFVKNAGALTRQAVREVSSRAAVQEFNMIGNTLPNPEMSPQGLQRVQNELIGLTDYKVAKAQAQQQWELQHGGLGSVSGFETDWQHNASPYAFIVARMAPEDRQAMIAKLQGSSEGQHELLRLRDQLQYVKQSGLAP